MAETRQAGIISATWFFMLVNNLGSSTMGFAGPSIMKSLSMTPGSFGIVLSSFGVGYLLAQIPGGLLADRWGAKPLLVIGPILWALLTGATGLVATTTGFVTVRVLFGASEGLAGTSTFKTVGENFSSKQRGRAMAICSTAIAAAPAFGGALVSKLVDGWGWRTMFVIMMGPAVLAALINFFLIPADRPTRSTVLAAGSPQKDASFSEALRRPSFWLLAVGQFCIGTAYWGYRGWMPSYLALTRHIDLKSLGLLSSTPYVFAFFGMLLAGWLDGKVLYRHRPQSLACSCLLAGLFLFLAYRAETVPLSLVGLCGTALFLYGNTGPLTAFMLELAPEKSRAAYVGGVLTVGLLAGIIAPLLIGYLVSRTGTFASGFELMIAALCVTAACMLVLTRFVPAMHTPELAYAEPTVAAKALPP